MSRKRDRKLEVFRIANYEPIEIRFNSADSTFSAEFLGKRFVNTDINKLKSTLMDEADARQKTTWKPVILIETGSWHWERLASGIHIETRLLGTTFYPNCPYKQHLAHVHCEMHSDDLDINNWKPSNPQEEWTGDTKEKRLIDFTRERYETLKFLEQKMCEFKQRLLDVIRGDAAAEFVDALTDSKALFLQDEFSKKRLLTQPDNINK